MHIIQQFQVLYWNKFQPYIMKWPHVKSCSYSPRFQKKKNCRISLIDIRIWYAIDLKHFTILSEPTEIVRNEWNQICFTLRLLTRYSYSWTGCKSIIWRWLLLYVSAKLKFFNPGILIVISSCDDGIFYFIFFFLGLEVVSGRVVVFTFCICCVLSSWQVCYLTFSSCVPL